MPRLPRLRRLRRMTSLLVALAVACTTLVVASPAGAAVQLSIRHYSHDYIDITSWMGFPRVIGTVYPQQATVEVAIWAKGTTTPIRWVSKKSNTYGDFDVTLNVSYLDSSLPSGEYVFGISRVTEPQIGGPTVNQFVGQPLIIVNQRVLALGAYPGSGELEWGQTWTVDDANTETSPVRWYGASERTYQWQVDRVDVPGATSPTFTPAREHVGKKVRLVVTGTRSGYASATRTTLERPVVARAATLPTLTPDWAAGTLTVGASASAQVLLDGEVLAPGTHDLGHRVVGGSYRATDGYRITGGTTWSRDLRTQLQPEAPVVDTDAMTMTVPSAAGIRYRSNGAVLAAGTYPLRGSVTVAAEAVSDHDTVVVGPASWTLSATPTSVTPPPPTVQGQQLTIPERAGVEYRLDGAPLAPGTHDRAGLLQVTAHPAAPRYELTGTTSWFFDTRQRLTAPAPVLDQRTLTWQVPSAPGVEYLLDGEPTTGATVPAGAHTLTARPAHNGVVLGGTRVWSLQAAPVQASAPAPYRDPVGGHLVLPAHPAVAWQVDGVGTSPGALPLQRRVTVTATGSGPGYQLTGATSWSFDLRRVLTPLEPAVDRVAGVVTIPEVAGVEYLLDGQVVAAGEHPWSSGSTLSVRAVDEVGTRLDDTVDLTWASSLPSTVVATAPRAARGLLTVPRTTGVEYRVDGEPTPAGQYRTERRVTVTAHPVSSAWLLDGVVSWTFDLSRTTSAPPTVALVGVKAVRPTFRKRTGKLRIPRRAGLVYRVGKKVVAGGRTLTVRRGRKVVVTVRATAGHRVEGRTRWTFRRPR